MILADALASSPICSGDASSEDQEIQASYRAALSRAYYAVFNASYNYLRDVEKDFALMMPILQKMGQSFTPAQVEQVSRDTRSIHDYVLKRLALDAHDAKKNNLRKSLRKVLGELKERRIEADYHEQHNFDGKTVRKTIGDAKTAMNYAQQLLN